MEKQVKRIKELSLSDIAREYLRLLPRPDVRVMCDKEDKMYLEIDGYDKSAGSLSLTPVIYESTHFSNYSLDEDGMIRLLLDLMSKVSYRAENDGKRQAIMDLVNFATEQLTQEGII